MEIRFVSHLSLASSFDSFHALFLSRCQRDGGAENAFGKIFHIAHFLMKLFTSFVRGDYVAVSASNFG
jgi:hypothetical protein